LAGSIVFALGIADYFNLNLFHFKDELAAKFVPIFISTIGNINIYCSYGSLILGLVAAIYTTWPKKTGAVPYYFLLILAFIGLIIGNSDSAYLALGTLLAALPLYLFQNKIGICRYLMMVSALLFSFMAVKMCDVHLKNMVSAPEGIRAMIAAWDGFAFLCLAFWGITAAVCIFHYVHQREETNPGKKAQAAWSIFLVLAAIALSAVLVDANFLGNAQRYGRLGAYVVFNDTWGTNRGYAWRKALENYSTFPLLQKILGHGPDTFGIISYFRNAVESTSVYGEFFDSAHNEYLQFFVTIGPIGTAAYILFLVLSVRDMVKCHCSPYVMGCAAAVLCYCVQAVVNIGQPISTPIMWTLLAMGIAECRRDRLHEIKKHETERNREINIDEKKQ